MCEPDSKAPFARPRIECTLDKGRDSVLLPHLRAAYAGDPKGSPRFVKIRVSPARLPPCILRKYEEIETSTLKDKVLSSRSEMIDFINKRSKVTTESGNERGLEKVHGERPINEWHASNNLMLLTRDDLKWIIIGRTLLDGSDDQSQSFLIARHSNKKPHELAAKMILPRHPKLVHPDGEDPVCGMTKMAVLMPQFRGPKGEWIAAGPVSPL
ncbi:predicted protein [Histoplasma capsulatum G186AR]|uniref:Uncharacterized protein n=1 Tax=Ajellomyces capsulatus (strain G186AR / H82 / ATCC MYA-2454 / RMSCC 2432) TaxID=447093 RepID=C0NHU3_AJECG|nr:uncharacterized protein HCBG_02915 [Histoplasma capsulatum G186AR]EEH09378.1 predicted protein [Histoplasma capsulatum G186AR]